VLQCVAACCSVLQCVAVCCSVLHCVAVCCSVLQWVIHSSSLVLRKFYFLHSSVLQCVAVSVCCSASVLHCVAVCSIFTLKVLFSPKSALVISNFKRRELTFVDATHCNTLQRRVTHCNTLQHTATHCNTLQHTATQIFRGKWTCANINRIFISNFKWRELTFVDATHCNTLQHTATHCNTLQHTATHCNTLQHTATQIFMGKWTCENINRVFISNFQMTRADFLAKVWWWRSRMRICLTYYIFMFSHPTYHIYTFSHPSHHVKIFAYPTYHIPSYHIEKSVMMEL